MWTRLFAFAFVVSLASTIACSSSKKGEECSDKGTIGGDCEEGLICTHSKPDDASSLVCLQPCLEQAACGANETCNGDRGRNAQACRPF